MNRKSIVQEYFALAADKNGYMPPMNKDKANAGMVAACIMDLLLNEVITIENNKITVIKEIPHELGHIVSLYEYLSEKPRSTKKLMSDYYIGLRINTLTADIGKSLFADGAAAQGVGGIFGPKTTYIPEKNYREELISILKSTVTKDDQITPQDVALIYILKVSNNLNQYFSKYEAEELKEKLKEMKKNPQNKQLADMINYVSDMIDLMMFLIIIQSI